MDLFGVHLIGLTATTFHKILLTVAAVAVVVVVKSVIMLGVRAGAGQRERIVFWSRQVANVIGAALVLIALLSIWVTEPAKLTTAAGLVTAGLAVALQKVWTSLAGYLVILRGRTFRVGDRIVMGGVRGDVVSLGFLQTRIAEMGQPPPMQKEDPAVWVGARQFTGRIVSVTNDKVFDTPVFNLTQEFPFLFDEMMIPIKVGDDHERAEQILLQAAKNATKEWADEAREAAKSFKKEYFADLGDTEPHVFYKITDNWLELTLRFVGPERGMRYVKDAIAREILSRFDEAGIGIASATYDVVGLPPIKVQLEGAEKKPEKAAAPRQRPSYA